MIFLKIRKSISRYHVNLRGWHTKRKIVVFESDDWGSVRMPNKYTYDFLLSKGIRVDLCPFNRYDSLASEDDLSALFEVLTGIIDKNGRYPVLTANCVIANPDFNKIKSSNFNEYNYELFTDTLKKYPNHFKSFELWKQGISEKIFYPQFHGREHLNISRWLEALRIGLPETRLAFDSRLFGLSTTISTENRKSYLAAFEVYTNQELIKIKNTIDEGLSLFYKIFGYKSKSFIAPNYTWPSEVEKYLEKNNVVYIQGMRIQFSPILGTSQRKEISHFTGQTNVFGQTYVVRNCHFEPTLYPEKDSIYECLKQIDIAFKCGKPAIIGCHRVNFIGSIFEVNRKTNLKMFRELLKMIKIKWPDVEFMSTIELGDLITEPFNLY